MSQTLSHRLAALRSFLAEQDLDGFVIWRDDMFMGEEVRPMDERLAMISGFTGSAGYAVILQDRAAVFSDGRYHLQLENQLDKALWQWRDSAPDAMQNWLAEGQQTALRLGYDATTTSVARYHKLPEIAEDATLSWQGFARNPLDDIWSDRPVHHRQAAYQLASDITGQSAEEKITALQVELAANGQEGLIISGPDCVNWLLNIRGDDLANTPFHLAFAFLPQQGNVVLIEGESPDFETVSWQDFCRTLPKGRYGFDEATLPMALFQALERPEITLEPAPCPIYMPKAKKNAAELAGFREAHLRDALSLCRFWFWLEQCQDITDYQETDLVALLREQRRKDDSYLCDSFDTIMGSGANGAIIHYRAIEGKDSAICQDNLLLIDSGAHYKTGTTDITRTFIIGTPDDEMISAYSAVLSAHIALARAHFPKGVNGAALDAICRAPLWATGRDYAHGTGHGVGHILSVHEGPAHISKRSGPALDKGMVLSNEPGFYEAGKWGIRLENLVAVTPSKALADGFCFETLTLVPFEQDLIDKTLLDSAAIQWLDHYHAVVFEALAPHLETDVMRHWLSQKCSPLL